MNVPNLFGPNGSRVDLTSIASNVNIADEAFKYQIEGLTVLDYSSVSGFVRLNSGAAGTTRIGGTVFLGTNNAMYVTATGQIVLASLAAPASASATGTAGEVRWDANYIYICTATNTWKRVAIATW